MIWLRSLLFVGWFYLLSIPLAILYSLALVLPRGVMREAMRAWSRLVRFGLLAIAGIRVEVRGAEHMPRGPALIAAKHQCMYDFIAPLGFLPDACFVLKKELLNIPLFGWHARKAKMIPIDRSGHSKAVRQLMADAKDRIADGRQIIIYPEGTRRPPGAPPEYKPGAAALYRELELPCTPLAVNTGVHWPNKAILMRPGTIVFEFLPPIPPGLKRADFMRELQTRIETASDALLAERL